jgi:hypothetical protein
MTKYSKDQLCSILDTVVGVLPRGHDVGLEQVEVALVHEVGGAHEVVEES